MFGRSSYIFISLVTLAACGQVKDDSSASQTSGIFDFLKPKTVSLCASAPLLKDAEIGRSWRTRVSSDSITLEEKILGFEISEEVRRSSDPLSGSGVETRKVCSRAYTQALGSKSVVYLEKDAKPGAARLLEIKETYAYALIQNYSAANSQSTLSILSLKSGTRSPLVSESMASCSPSTLALPSPLGKRIALLTIIRDCMDDSAPQTAKFTLLDHEGQSTGIAESIHVFASYPSFTWTDEDHALLSDAITSKEFDFEQKPAEKI